MITAPSRLIRRFFVGKGQEFIFNREKPGLGEIKKTDFYLHIPFCRNMCPYCPYNRVEYDKDLVRPYLLAVLKEISLYREKLGKTEISSVYIGGGTPTNLVDEVGIILDALRENFSLTGEVCMETSPADLDGEKIKKLRGMGVDLLSVGVQSFEDRHLKTLGRKYDAGKGEEALKSALAAGFKGVNADLMFVLPGQNEKNALADLDRAMELGVNQITAYPLFTFPYTSVGRHLNLSGIKMPDFFKRRKMYRKIYERCAEKGYEQVSVWGFKKGEMPRYSSVTRNNYIGLGAGACSMLPGAFYLNTFSVKAYIASLLNDKLPIALNMHISPELNRYYWLYWRFYDARINKAALKKTFGKKDFKINLLFFFLKTFGFCREKDGEFLLTERGSFYIHLLQNYFILNYINKVWTAAKAEPWPEKIEI
ncbi:MAG: hypothetical protein COT17_01530 [Elusimicrobia bacterium CG08_land_8_20_14_0_20_51_18]|nr:MAG: hypothetical protein COT17_01530 [Elusimicrobia bacterium CG08_land_8_20_14_0_20_51_18]